MTQRHQPRFWFELALAPILAVVAPFPAGGAEECRALYGIHDHDPDPAEYLNHFQPGTGCGWITATVAVGHNPADTGGVDFRPWTDQGHTVICRINHGYYPNGTIPLPLDYANFAQRCANFAANSPGCDHWVIGNELNIAGEWPFNGTRHAYVSPQQYAACFRQVYDAIKTVRPEAKVLPAALAPWAGPFSAGTLGTQPHDANPISWVEYLNQMLTAIAGSGPLDGIALHINSRGYRYADIHSTERRTVRGMSLSWSFGVYKDWIDLGIPRSLYHLPLYATECNGYYFWKGGHAENTSAHYEPGWVQEIYAEIDRHNRSAVLEGKPAFRCVNLYRWCAACDGWNIDGSSNPYKAQMLADLDAAVAANYRWPSPSKVRTNFVAAGSIWKFQDAGANLGSAWRLPSYNDTAWPSGPAQLGYGDGDEATVISSNRTDGSRILTTYFRRTFLVPELGRVTNLDLRLVRDDGAVVYLNGSEVFRDNMPSGAIDYLTPASSAVSGADESNFHSAPPISPAFLREGSNLLAVEIHQSGTTSSDVSFDLELAGIQRASPDVAIAAPPSGIQAAPPTLHIQTQVEDQDGTVSRVEFYLGQTWLGRDEAAPFDMAWASPPPGNYTLTAVAWDNDGLATTSAPVNVTLGQEFIRAGADWKYLDNGSNQGTAWRDVTFNDAAWSSGPAQLGYGDSDEATVVGYGSNPANKHITTWFRHRFHVEDTSEVAHIMLRVLRDDGIVVYLNGTEIFRDNLPAGSVSYLTLASGAIGGADEVRFLEATLGAGSLRPGENLLAVEVHQAAPDSSDLSFDLELLGLAPARVPRLQIVIHSGMIELSWPVSAQEYRLEMAATLPPPTDVVWTPVLEPVRLDGRQLRVTVASSLAFRAFRLVKPQRASG